MENNTYLDNECMSQPITEDTKFIFVEVKIEEVVQGLWRWNDDLKKLRDYVIHIAYPASILMLNDAFNLSIRSIIFSEDINEIGLNEYEKEYILLSESLANSVGDKNIVEELEMLDAYLNSIGYEIKTYVFNSPEEALPFALDLEKYVPEGEIGMGGFLYDVIYGDDTEEMEEENWEEDE